MKHIENSRVPLSLLVKHSQFVVFNRRDAERFVNNWKPVVVHKNRPPEWHVHMLSLRWHKTDHTFPYTLDISNWIPNARNVDAVCAAEFAPFATVFGPLEGETSFSQ